jgi:uncharacterized protein YegJ (DUF2314 family)
MPIIVAGFVLCAIMVVGFSFIDMVSNKQGQKGRTIENTSTPALEQAKLQAQQNWQEFVQAFANRRPGDVFFVKAPFSEGGPVEHMWVNVQSMSDQGMAGTLDSRPQLLRQVKAGDPLQIALNEMEDWTYVSGGQRHGYFSYAAAMAQQQAANGGSGLLNGQGNGQGDGQGNGQGGQGGNLFGGFQGAQGQSGQGGFQGQGDGNQGQGAGGLSGLMQSLMGQAQGAGGASQDGANGAQPDGRDGQMDAQQEQLDQANQEAERQAQEQAEQAREQEQAQQSAEDSQR